MKRLLFFLLILPFFTFGQEDYSDYEIKSWSNYMTNRFLSMKSDWIEVINEVQKYPLKVR